ncbi:MAG: hypothetical protein M1838_000206 [Thelocarpon superellum]|nr:MAG: hypothetical protein M1838_000206 [Thelocarpon superellum]
MPGFFSKVFGGKDGPRSSSKLGKPLQDGYSSTPVLQKPQWEDAWTRKDVEPEEVQELLRGCTLELKSRALDVPFTLLPFRPTSDPSAARTFIRNYFNPSRTRGAHMDIEELQQELRLTEPMVLCSVVKWCWSRLPGGVVSWDAYELFRVGEHDSNQARDAFATFIPLSVDSDARTKIIFDFFDLMAAIAAHGKTNGLGGRKLSRFAGWWAFEHSDSGDGFEGGYRSWAKAADATSHLFFAYLRSLSPESVRGINGISQLPLSLQQLVQGTEYPPEAPSLMQTRTSKVVMIVDSVSPTPFALLRRAKHFEYRANDRALQAFASYDDPVDALTEECLRVLKCISSTNQSDVSSSKASTSLRDASWSRFEDIGFSGLMDESDQEERGPLSANRRQGPPRGLNAMPRSRTADLGRPTTPSWADFLSAGFADEKGNRSPPPLLLPPDKILPPIDTDRTGSSQSYGRSADGSDLDPGELASITALDLDDCFWWVWISSLAGEESTERKAVFGRCALLETNIRGGRWLVVEEKVKGAAPPPEEGAYIVEKKSRFGFSKRGKLTQGKNSFRKNPAPAKPPVTTFGSKTPPVLSKANIAPDQHARIQAAAAALQQKQRGQGEIDGQPSLLRRARDRDGFSTKTASIFTLQPVILNEAAPAMKWANKFDKDAIREAYLGNNGAGRGSSSALAILEEKSDGAGTPTAGVTSPVATLTSPVTDRELPALPREEKRTPRDAAPPKKLATQGRPTAFTEASTPDTATGPEKPLPPVTKTVTQTGDERSSTPLPEGTPAVETAAASAESTPEKLRKGNKLKKKETGGGFKKLFGRKKAEDGAAAKAGATRSEESGVGRWPSTLRKKAPGSSRHAAPAPTESVDEAAVEPTEAPEASANGEAADTTEAEPVDQGEGAPEATDETALEPVADDVPIPAEEPVSEPVLEEVPEPTHEEVARPAPEPETEAVAPPSQPALHPANQALIDSLKQQEPERDSAPAPISTSRRNAAKAASRITAEEEREAARAFSSFDQGPLQDVPAFVPEDSPARETASTPEPTPAPSANTKGGATSARAAEKVEESKQDPSPVKDRWAQIRKNAAASRAAAAAAERKGQGKPGPAVKTDLGDAAGEETIESRVARIKARVAELTNNAEDGQKPPRPVK